MNVRVHRAVSDIDGVTGMRIVRAIVAGERDAHELAKLRDRRCGKSEEEIVEQLSGHWREGHLFSLRQGFEKKEAHHEGGAGFLRGNLWEQSGEGRGGRTGAETAKS